MAEPSMTEYFVRHRSGPVIRVTDEFRRETEQLNPLTHQWLLLPKLKPFVKDSSRQTVRQGPMRLTPECRLSYRALLWQSGAGVAVRRLSTL